ncbi:MAG: polysaccharide deacetylase family protein [Firmicutes bacterium]|nr:polysaccharide deacetylase family protein [Bacillota bacterium]
MEPVTVEAQAALVAAMAATTVAYAAYTVAADAWGRRGATGVVRCGPAVPKVAITFDDGPSPHYTPALLELLDQTGAKASFFLTGRAAAAHPSIVRRIAASGHTVGVHTWRHRHAWLTAPWEVGRDLTRCAAVVGSLTGQVPRWFRPPWGTFNLATLTCPGRLGQRIVLWSVNSEDWRYDATPGHICEQVGAGLGQGAIVLMHDGCPRPGAGDRMLAALPRVIEQCSRAGLQPVTLDEMFEGEA